MKGRSAIKTGAPAVFEGMNERFVPLRHNEDLVDLRANEPLADGKAWRASKIDDVPVFEAILSCNRKPNVRVGRFVTSPHPHRPVPSPMAQQTCDEKQTAIVKIGLVEDLNFIHSFFKNNFNILTE